MNKNIIEHILVCLNSAPSNEKVVKSAIKIAKKNQARLSALYVKTKYNEKLDKESKRQLDYNMKLAEDAGANIVVTYGDDIAYQIAEYAKANIVSIIIIGHTKNHKYYLFRDKSIVNKLLNYYSDVDIYIIPDIDSKRFKQYPSKYQSINFPDLIFTLIILCLTAIIGLMIDIFLTVNEVNIVVFFILAVLLISRYTNGKLYGIMSSILGVAIYTFLFTEPKYSFQVARIEITFTLITMLVIAIVTNTLTVRVRTQARISATNAYRNSILFDMSQAISQANDLEDIIINTQKQIYKLIQTPFIFYLLSDDGNVLSTYNCNDRIVKLSNNDEIEFNNINYIYQNKTKLVDDNNVYIPLLSQKGIVAVISIQNYDLFDNEQKSLLNAMLNIVAYALERYYLNEAKNKALIMIENERFRLNLFRLLSHDLKTPLTGIQGSAKSILTNNFKQETVKELIADIYDESIWLANMIENILYLSKIEKDRLTLKKEPQLVDEIIDEALNHIYNKDNKKIIVTKIPDFLMINVDVQLLIQVIINLVNNAINHSKLGENIWIKVDVKDDMVIFLVEDDGEGIDEKYKEYLFDMYFTIDSDKKKRGLGLGLSLCKLIIEAHGGSITIEDNNPYGTIFKFTIPRVEVIVNDKFNTDNRR